MWETIGSLRIVSRPDDAIPWPHSVWARSVRRPIAASAEATRLVQWFRAQPAAYPALLTPPPRHPDLTMDAELAAILALEPSRIRAMAPALGPAPGLPVPDPATDPAGWRSWYADGLAAYWAVALTPYWSAMRNVLDEDILHRALILVNAGAEAMLAGLSPRVRWHRPVLTFPSATTDGTMRCSQSLVAVPTLFSRGLTVHLTDSGGVAFNYPARGVALLGMASGHTGAPGGPSPGDGMELLLGRSRAAILRNLSAPTTTSALATSLCLAPSTVSQHLATLTAAGLVSRVRAGGRVYYRLEARGAALLSDAGAGAA